MSWGKGITLTIIAFVCLMIFLVYKSVGVKTDLVSSNYYQEALNYNSVQLAKSNYSKLSSAVSIKKTEDYVQVELPNEAGKIQKK